MAFAASQLIKLPNQGLDYSEWVYDTADSVATVIAAGYITSGSADCYGMKVGDRIIVRVFTSVATKTSLTSMTHHIVTAVGASTTALGPADNLEREILSSGLLSANGGDAATTAWYIPYAFKVVAIRSVLIGGALATADFVITASIGAVAITTGAITVTQSGSAAFDLDTVSPTAANTGAAGAYIKVVGSGSSTGNRFVNVTVEIQRIG